MGKTRTKDLYKQFEDTVTLDACRHFCKWTVASLFPDSFLSEDVKDQTRNRVERDYQSFGAILLNNLAAKVTQVLFPADKAFFVLTPTKANAKLADSMGLSKENYASAVAALELAACQRLFLNGGYNALTQAVKLLAATGNALLYRDSATNKFHTYSLHNYVVRRDGSGNVLCVILREEIAKAALPMDVLERLGNKATQKKEYDTFTMYTRIERVTTEYERVVYASSDDVPDVDEEVEDASTSRVETVTSVTYKVTQEIEDIVLAEPSIYPEYLCPYVPLTWNLISGESYGRGLVEDYSSDFARYSENSEAIVDYEAEMMRLFYTVDPSLNTSVSDLEEAPTGIFISAVHTTKDPILAHEGGEANKLVALMNNMSVIEARLSKAFMYTGNVRDAERVTAEEIKTQIREADYSLGGVYSALAEAIHLPLAHILLAEEDSNVRQMLLEESFDIDVSVGLASLTREAKIAQLQYIANAVQVIMPAFVAFPRINQEAVLKVLFEGQGFPIDEVSFTDEQLQQKQEAQDQAMQESSDNMQQDAQTQQASIGDANLAKLSSEQLGRTE